MSDTATPGTAARQASLLFTVSQSLLKLMYIELVMPSNHLILCRPLLLLPSIFPSIRVFSNTLAPCIRWQSIGTSASASVLLMNIQGWFPLGLTARIDLTVKTYKNFICQSFVNFLIAYSFKCETTFLSWRYLNVISKHVRKNRPIGQCDRLCRAKIPYTWMRKLICIHLSGMTLVIKALAVKCLLLDFLPFPKD